MSDPAANTCLILLAIFLPPAAVAAKTGDGVTIGLNILLTLLGWIPGVLHAWYIITRVSRPAIAMVKGRPSRHSSNRRHSSSRRYIQDTHSQPRHRSRSSHRGPAMVHVEPGTTRYKRSSSTSRRYYV